MLPLRIAFDVLARLHFTDVEFAAALYAASTLPTSPDPWAPPAMASLLEAMSPA